MKYLLRRQITPGKIISVSILFFLFLITSPIHAQTGVIKGYLFDSKTREALSGATITIESIATTVITDRDGRFTIHDIPGGAYQLSATYTSYEKLTRAVVVIPDDTATIEVALTAESVLLNTVEIVARPNREMENILLNEQRKSLIATQVTGAQELSRKGAGDAEEALSKVSGISRQEGVKNVSVRGLGDRYNATLLNGMPVSSEDPEYKNISLSFFGADIIQTIGVNKVFSAKDNGDAGGAVINISSKELLNNQSLSLEIGEGLNSNTYRKTFLHPAGANFFGFANTRQPTPGKFDFTNNLDPSRVQIPLNQSFRLSGGRRINIGENPLSLYVVSTHATKYSYTGETVRNMTTTGTIYQDQTGNKYSEQTNQLVLANLNYKMPKGHSIAYNFMMLHANDQYVGEYVGKHTEKHQDGDQDMGYLRRQQINDNLLLTHQLLSKWTLTERLSLVADGSFNSIKGMEPDRRENYLSKKTDGTYGLTGSNRQKRFFSELKEQDYNAKLVLHYKLKDVYNRNNSGIMFGYNSRLSDNNFDAKEYNFSAIPGAYSIDHIALDELYNAANYGKGIFSIAEGPANSYSVNRNIQSLFAEGVFQLSSALTGSIGLRFDDVHIAVAYDVPGRADNNKIVKTYYLPDFHLKYDLNDRQALRLSVSKTYTLPQSKEISPYQYVDIGFASEGNPNLRPSDNYNFDIKWECYPRSSELLSVAAFYKRIVNPIGRVDKGNSAGLLTYDNISKSADVMGMEAEVRKNIFSMADAKAKNTHKLSVGLNASFLDAALILSVLNTPERKSGLEGAAPFILNTDVSYYYSGAKNSLTTTLVFNYFSNRIYTNGTLGYQDIIEEGIPTLDWVSSFKFNKNISLKLKAANLLNPDFNLTRKSNINNEKIILNQYKKGIDLSLGISIDL